MDSDRIKHWSAYALLGVCLLGPLALIVLAILDN